LVLAINHELIKILVIDNVGMLNLLKLDVNSTEHERIVKIKDFLKNETFIPKNSIQSGFYNNKLGYINLQELLNELFGETFSYSIIINDNMIINNGDDTSEIGFVRKGRSLGYF